MSDPKKPDKVAVALEVLTAFAMAPADSAIFTAVGTQPTYAAAMSVLRNFLEKE